MKLRQIPMAYEAVMALPRPAHRKPWKASFLMRTLVRVVAQFGLMAAHFTCQTHGMEKIPKGTPCLYLMNHSSFIDLEISAKIFYPKPYGIVCTTDAFVGKNLLMRLIGCFPTRKFISDLTLVQDMEYLLKEKKTNVLMYPEAGYSFDGTATTLPRKLGVLLKRLGVPVVTVITQGAYTRQPLYNVLKKRKVKVRADVTCLFTPEELREMSVAQLDEALDRMFGFDSFAWQQENHIRVAEPDRAEGLNRVLYRCPHCDAEGQMEGKGTTLTCHSCGKVYTLTELGALEAPNPRFTHVPDWYRWQREQVRQELLSGTYRLETEVDIGLMVNYKGLYMVGTGTLLHTAEGFTLTDAQGKELFHQGVLTSYSLNADYYWYEIGDVICIGDNHTLYYCFPKAKDVVTKARFAAEELYKLKKSRRSRTSAQS